MEDDISWLGLFCTEVDVRVKMFEDHEHKVTEAECGEIIEANQCELLLERRLIEQQDNLFDVLWLDLFLLNES